MEYGYSLPSFLKDENVPDILKGRMSTNEYKLTVKINESKSVVVDEFYEYYDVFKRKNVENMEWELWLYCQSWKRKRGVPAQSVFVNLETGETHYPCESLNFWRGCLKFSPNGHLALVTARIQGSSAKKILVIDLTDWNNVTVIHQELNCEAEVSFNNDNQVVFKHELMTLRDKGTVYNVTDPEVIINMYDEELDVTLKTLTTIIVRERDETKITSDMRKKWGDECNYKEMSEQRTFVTVDEMKIVSKKKYGKCKNIIFQEQHIDCETIEKEFRQIKI